MPDGCVCSEKADSFQPGHDAVGPFEPGLTEQAGEGEEATPQERTEGGIVRVEANFLRLPLFALDNKRMRTMDGLRCEGTFRRAGERYAFTFVATRNARTLYPGPVARSAHLAILSLATERGLPLQNPIVFTWRELLARMELSVSGRTVREVKQAMLATKGLMIESQHALFCKTTGKPLDTGSQFNQVVGIYDELEFFGTVRPDQSRADINAVWLSRWYLDNLNALFSGPLDYDLWRRLDRQSPIASRLYEFLFLKFYAGRELLRFNYPNLVRFIPARRERYLSDAKKQLGPALSLLQDCGILADAAWSQSRDGDPQLLLRRGPVLSAKTGLAPAGYDVGEEDFVLDQLQNIRLPEWQIVEDFHQRWGHADYRPSKAELKTARDLLAKHGKEKLAGLIPLVVKQMKSKWPDAKTFVAVTRYLDEALAEHGREERRNARREAEDAVESQERTQAIERAKRQATLQALWQKLPEDERETIRQAVLATQPPSLRKHPALIERFCLEELNRREIRSAGPSAERESSNAA